jgi:putative oxidoreductase
MDHNKPLPFPVSSYSSLTGIASSLQSPLLLGVRLYWGWQFAMSGWGKLHRLSEMTAYFATLNLPLPAFTATFVSGLEFVGGLLLIIGLGSRFIGLLLTVAMSVAYLTAQRPELLSVFSDPVQFYSADPFTFLFAALLVLIFGPGRFSLDFLMSRLVAQKLG